MKFSIVLIARNEEKTLPKLLESVKGVEEIILVDTGSTDKTCEVAESYGVKVYKEGDRFREVIDAEMGKTINDLFKKYNQEPLVKEGDSAFNFAKARNYAATLATNNMIFMPDCDEAVIWDLPKLEKEIEGADRLEYNFIYAHDEAGKSLLNFAHSKFYNRDKFKWVRNIHEVLQGEGVTKKLPVEVIELHHWQNMETNRDGYLKGLLIDYLQNDYNDRNMHYLGREFYYRPGLEDLAIEFFEKHIANPGWLPEQMQSMIYIAECYKKKGEIEKAIEYYLRAQKNEVRRREPYIGLGNIYYDRKEWEKAGIQFWTSLFIPFDAFYANYKPYYEDYPHGQLAVCLWQLGRKKESYEQLKLALTFAPNHKGYNNNLQFYKDII